MELEVQKGVCAEYTAVVVFFLDLCPRISAKFSAAAEPLLKTFGFFFSFFFFYITPQLCEGPQFTDAGPLAAVLHKPRHLKRFYIDNLHNGVKRLAACLDSCVQP